MFSTTRITFPKGSNVSLPCYQVHHFNGNQLELTPEGQHLQVNFNHFDAPSIVNATATQPEDWEIRGLIAVDSWPFANGLREAMIDGNARRFGSVFDGVWYQAAPIALHFTRHLGEYVVVGLYR